MNKKRNIVLFTLILSGIFGTIFSVFASFSVTLDSAFFTGILAPAQYNPVEINFNMNGNNSVGMMFLIDSKTGVTENVILSGTTYSCTKQVRGLYYNSARGERIWPLDQDVLTTLTAIDSSYTALSITGGLFTNCSGTGAISTGVYGQIKHTRNLTDYYITAGTEYNTSGDIIETYANNMTLVESTNKTMSGIIHDTYGKRGIVSSINLSGTLSGNKIAYLTSSMIQSGTTWYTSNPSITYKLTSYTPVTINYELTGDITSIITGTIGNGTLTGNVTLTSTNGTKTLGVKYSWMSLVYSTSTTLFLDTLAPTVPTISTGGTYTIGQTNLSRSGSTDTGVGLSGYVYEVANDPNFYYHTIVRSGTSTITTQNLIHNTNFLTGTFYARVASKDKLGNQSAWSTTHILTVTGTYDTQVDDFSLGTKSNAKLETVYKSKTIMIAGLSANVEVPITVEAEATKGVIFKNDSIAGLTTSVQNGDEIYVELMSSDEYNDEVSSKLSIGTGDNKKSGYFRITTMDEEDVHSMDYDELEYNKIKVYMIFKGIIDEYALNAKGLVAFFKATTTLVEEKIEDLDEDDDEMSIELLEYFQELIETWMTENVYVAPNEKTYFIQYIDAKKAYTSPNFISVKYFPDKARMFTHININNPVGSTTHASAGVAVASWNHTVDFNYQAVVFMAPNGKQYTIGRTTTLKFFSYNFIYPRYFDSLDAIKTYITQQNPKK